jgi:anti-sigma factor RsiW
MFRCFFIEKKLYEYLDNTLSEKETIALREHLEVCPRCARSLSEIARVIRWASEIPVPRPGEDFWHNFKAELNYKLNQRSGVSVRNKHVSISRAKLVLAAAFILIVVLAAGALLRFSGKQEAGKDPDMLLIKDIRALEEITFDSDPEFHATVYIDGLQLALQQNQSS